MPKDAYLEGGGERFVLPAGLYFGYFWGSERTTKTSQKTGNTYESWTLYHRLTHNGNKEPLKKAIYWKAFLFKNQVADICLRFDADLRPESFKPLMGKPVLVRVVHVQELRETGDMELEENGTVKLDGKNEPILVMKNTTQARIVLWSTWPNAKPLTKERMEDIEALEASERAASSSSRIEEDENLPF